MSKKLLIATVGIAAAVIALSGCAQQQQPPTPVIAPVTVEVGDLQGETVDLIVGQTLNINTGDLPVESYSAQVADPAIAEFSAGYTDGSATFNPGLKALAVGSTEVVLSNSNGGIQDVTFTIDVTAK